MSHDALNEKALWSNVTTMLGNRHNVLGRHWSYNLYNDPKRLAFVLSRYKFAAKMGSRGQAVLELGCSDGIGVPILSEFASGYTGIDMDESAIQTASANWGNDRRRFLLGDFLGQTYGTFETVVSLDVIEHIHLEDERLFFETVLANLSKDGMCIIGTPNITSETYASEASKCGHVNLYDAKRLKGTVGQFFSNAFLFGINDEIVHTGFSPMAHYLMCIGCNRR